MPTVNVTATDSTGQVASASASYTIAAAGRPPLLVPGYGVESWFDDFSGGLSAASWTALTGAEGAPREHYNQPANVTTGASGLAITARRESVGGKAWTSGHITTTGKRTFSRGLVEAEIQLPAMSAAAAGVWPAFWLRSDTTPAEMDIMESYGEPFKAGIPANETAQMHQSFASTTHTDTNGGAGNHKVVLAPPGGTVADGSVHRYGVSIDDTDGITYWFDGAPMGDVYARPNPMSWSYLATKSIPANIYVNLCIKLNLQIGSSYWGPSTAGTAAPVSMRVHWVRILTKG